MFQSCTIGTVPLTEHNRSTKISKISETPLPPLDCTLHVFVVTDYRTLSPPFETSAYAPGLLITGQAKRTFHTNIYKSTILPLFQSLCFTTSFEY